MIPTQSSFDSKLQGIRKLFVSLDILAAAATLAQREF